VLVAVFMNLYGSTGLDGDPMFLGMAYGLADTSAAIMSGFVLRYVKDYNAFRVSYLIAICGMVTFYYSTKDGKSSLISYISYYFTELGCAFNYTSIFLMIEHRTPIEHLGSALVVVFSIGMVASSASPYIVTQDQPIPFYTSISLFVAAIVCCSLLPAPKFQHI
jgi:predicted MFS family arabinose efflux permease